MQRRNATSDARAESLPFVRTLEIGLNVLGWLLILATPVLAVGLVRLDPAFLPGNVVVAYVLVFWSLGTAIGVGWLASLAFVEVLVAMSTRVAPVRVPLLERVADAA